VVRVGWFVDIDRGAVIYDAPRPLSRTFDFAATDRKAPTHCPAVQSFASAMYVVPCPFKLSLRCVAHEQAWEFRLDRRQSELDPDAANELFTFLPRREWRHPQRPIVQIQAPYVFVSDDEVELTQVPSHQHYQPDRPGVVIAGRFPIRDWPRPLSFAFEWHDVAAPLKLARGEPWFYLTFETRTGERVRLERIAKTEAIARYIAHISDVATYTGRTFDLMNKAREVRPPRLLPEMADDRT
jgi:hypothetical protein